MCPALAPYLLISVDGKNPVPHWGSRFVFIRGDTETGGFKDFLRAADGDKSPVEARLCLSIWLFSSGKMKPNPCYAHWTGEF